MLAPCLASEGGPTRHLRPHLDDYLAALEERHLANLTRSELTRALRALSSCYVERRDKLAGGAALDGAGKRAAFALFYGPVHFLTISAIVRALGAEARIVKTIHDLGCGTGVGGAAWALACDPAPSIAGLDRSAWAAAEANWTYRQFGLRGTAKVGDLAKFPHSHISTSPHAAILLAYAVNELPGPSRAALLAHVADRVTRGSPLLVVEPIAKKDRGWWPEWAARLTDAGAVEHEWRFPADLPPALRQIAKGAGLDPRELTARTLWRP
jgi:hypothetical protein